MLKPLSVLAPLLLLVACSSTGIHRPSRGEPMRVSFLMYGSRERFELANEAHTDPVSLYSTSRSNSGMKIADDEVLLDVLAYLGDHGFGEHELGGPAPRWGTTPFTIAFEVETESGVSHWGTSNVSPTEERVEMTSCWRYFFNEAYNRVDAYQSVENDEGRHKFEPQPLLR